jgi:hypothetical protein
VGNNLNVGAYEIKREKRRNKKEEESTGILSLSCFLVATK